MAIPSRQIGWGTESNLLWQILKQLNKLTSVLFGLKEAATPNYKVYTALLTQSGTSNEVSQDSGLLTIGITYLINRDTSEYGADFTIVGAPNNTLGTKFVATGTTPNWGTTPIIDMLTYDPGAPVATVLENTIGNVWFTYDSVGDYSIRSINAFTVGKTYVSSQLNNNSNAYNTEFQLQDPSSDSIRLQAKDENWNQIDLDGFGIVLEIRVYN